MKLRQSDLGGGVSVPVWLGIGPVVAFACTLLLVSRAPVPPAPALGEPAVAPAVDPIAAVEPIRHAIVPAGTGLRVADGRYVAEFGADGFTLAHRDGSAAFALQTKTVGGASTPDADWRADGNVAERDVGPGVTERVTARDGAVEWDFVLSSEPGVAGDFLISAAVDGPGAPTQMRDELRWPAAHGRSFRMGELVVVDARGRELYRALPVGSATRVELRIPAEVLARAVYPVVVDPVVSVAYPVADSAGGAPATGEQLAPAVAFNGTNFLVVWEDWGSGEDANIYGARVTPAGVVLDPGGIAISTAEEDQSRPAVSSDGTNFMVVWDDRRTSLRRLNGARVSAAGAVLDPASVPISTTNGDHFSADIAFDGSNYLVVWEEWRPVPPEFENLEPDIMGARLSPSGTVLTSQIPISTATDYQRRPRVAFNGTKFLVVWGATFQGQVWGSQVTTAGVVETAVKISGSDSADDEPAVASNGTHYLVVWPVHGGGSDDIRGARVDGAGAVVDAAGITIGEAISDPNLLQPTVASDGSDFLTVWEDAECSSCGGSMRGARVSAAGSVLDPAGIPYGVGSGPALRYADGQYLLAAETNDDIRALRLTTAGAITGTPFLASQGPASQTNLAVAFDGTNYLAVWEDDRPGAETDIYAGRVTPGGVKLDGAGIPISTAAGSQTRPSVAFDGTNYLIVWEDLRSEDNWDVYGARLSPAGSLVGGEIPISTGPASESGPAVVFDGTNNFVAWADIRSDDSWDIYGTRVSPAGAVLDATGLPISTGESQEFDPQVSSGGTNVLVAWTDEGGDGSVRGARVSGAGAVLDPAGISISAASEAQTSPSVAFDGTNYLVAWEDFRSENTRDVYGARVSLAGTVLDASGIAIAAGSSVDEYEPAVVFDGTNLVVVTTVDNFDDPFDVVAKRVSPAGAVLDTSAFAVAASSAHELRPTAVRSGSTLGVAYEGSPSLSGARSGQLRVLNTQPSVSTPTIDSGPSGTVGSSQATFTFSGGGTGVTYECRRDSDPFATCTSPKTFTGFGSGQHTFDVRATDAGLTSESATRTWTVDITPPPVPTFTTTPPSATGSTASFSFSDTEAGVTFQCSLDSTTNFTTCTSPRTFTGLTAGNHTFRVRARDALLNTSASLAQTWTVDLTGPPTPTIDSGPTGTVASADASFTFSDTEAGATFQCSLDSTTNFTPCASPQAYSSVAQGSHTFRVRAVDAFANVGSAASRSWTVDTVAPIPPTLGVTGPSGTVKDTSASFAFGGSEGGAVFECRLDTAAFAVCSSPVQFSGLADGSHTFEVRAKDAVGNASSAVGRTWTIDTTAPPIPVFVSGPAGTVRSTSATIAFSDAESGALFQCALDGASFSTCTSPVNLTNLTQGAHSFQVRAFDPLGNTSSATSRAWAVDTVPPQTSIGTKPKAKTTARTAKFAFKSEKGAKFECKLDKAGFKACKSPVTFKNLKPGKHTLQVRAKDALGNVDKTPAKFSWTIKK